MGRDGLDARMKFRFGANERSDGGEGGGSTVTLVGETKI